MNFPDNHSYKLNPGYQNYHQDNLIQYDPSNCWPMKDHIKVNSNSENLIKRRLNLHSLGESNPRIYIK